LSDYSASEPTQGGMLGELQLKDYINLARRRKWWIILTAAAISVIAVTVAYRLPDYFRSETVIMVDPQQVPSNYVASPVTTSIQDRLSTIQQQVMSPSRLKKVIDTLGLYPELRGKVSDQVTIAKMQKATTIEVANAGDRRLSSFRIGFQAAEPHVAAKVANELATQFIDENLRVRGEQFSGTTDFLNAELQDTKRQLEQKESEMGRVKSTYIMDLPESKQYHLEALTTLRNELRESQDRVSQDQQQKVMLQSMLASSSPAVDLDPDNGEMSGSPAHRQIEKLETSLSELRARYGSSYPDVRKIQSQIDDLKKKEEQELKNGPAVGEQPTLRNAVKNPVIEAQLQKLDDEIATEQKRQPDLQQQIDFHSSKLEREPVFEQQIAGLMRDYDTLRGHYNLLLDKKLSAEMATQLESRQEGERFVVLDAAPVPDAPAGPNRILIAAAGILAGMLAGFALAVVVEMADECVRNEKEAAQLAGKGVLAGIPLIRTRGETLKLRWQVAAALAATVVVSGGLGYGISLVAKRFF